MYMSGLLKQKPVSYPPTVLLVYCTLLLVDCETKYILPVYIQYLFVWGLDKGGSTVIISLLDYYCMYMYINHKLHTCMFILVHVYVQIVNIVNTLL